MIGKVCKRRDLKGTGSDDFTDAVSYVARKATAVVLVNLPGTWPDAPDFMRLTAAANMRVKRPVYHLVVSFSALEQPTDAEAIAVATELLRILDADRHQAVIAIHRDRKHVHIHIVLNRIHPMSFRALSRSNDFAELEKACRRIEAAKGWSADRGRFDVDKVGRQIVLKPKPASHWNAVRQDRQDGRRPSDRTWDLQYERRTGQAPLRHRLADLLPDLWRVITQARTWAMLHAGLERLGFLYARYRSGARLYLHGTEEFMKPSHLGDACSRHSVEKRLGPWQEPGPRAAPPPAQRRDCIATGSPAPADVLLTESRIFRRVLPARLYAAVTSDSESLAALRRVDLETDEPRFAFGDGTDIRDRGATIVGAGGGSDARKAHLVVAIAAAKRWASIRLAGSPAFVRAGADAARDAGLTVEGATPGRPTPPKERRGRPSRSSLELAQEVWVRKEAERENALDHNAALRAALQRKRRALFQQQKVETVELRDLGRNPVAQALRHRTAQRYRDQRAQLQRRRSDIVPVPRKLNLRDLLEQVDPDAARRLRHADPCRSPGAWDHTACRQHWMAAPARGGRPAGATALALSPETFSRFREALRPAPGGGILMAHTDARGNVTGFEHHDGHTDRTRRSGVARGGLRSAVVFGNPPTAPRAVVCGIRPRGTVACRARRPAGHDLRLDRWLGPPNAGTAAAAAFRQDSARRHGRPPGRAPGGRSQRGAAPPAGRGKLARASPRPLVERPAARGSGGAQHGHIGGCAALRGPIAVLLRGCGKSPRRELAEHLDARGNGDQRLRSLHAELVVPEHPPVSAEPATNLNSACSRRRGLKPKPARIARVGLTNIRRGPDKT